MVVCIGGNEINPPLFIWIADLFFDKIANNVWYQKGMIYVRQNQQTTSYNQL